VASGVVCGRMLASRSDLHLADVGTAIVGERSAASRPIGGLPGPVRRVVATDGRSSRFGPSARAVSPEQLATAVEVVGPMVQLVSERRAKGEPTPDYCTPDWIQG
jgi:hypothetical protein